MIKYCVGGNLVTRWSETLSVFEQDPNIKGMAEQIAQDPAFAQMSAALQASMGGTGESGLGAAAGANGVPQIDPDQYAQAMTSVLQNPQFMDMAEKLGQQIMQVCLNAHAIDTAARALDT